MKRNNENIYCPNCGSAIIGPYDADYGNDFACECGCVWSEEERQAPRLAWEYFKTELENNGFSLTFRNLRLDINGRANKLYTHRMCSIPTIVIVTLGWTEFVKELQ